MMQNRPAGFALLNPYSFFFHFHNLPMHAQNQSLLDALNACIAACEHCATACLKEEDVKMMVRCISIDRDCADIWG